MRRTRGEPPSKLRDQEDQGVGGGGKGGGGEEDEERKTEATENQESPTQKKLALR